MARRPDQSRHRSESVRRSEFLTEGEQRAGGRPGVNTPAQNPEPVSARQRLAQISHHFLSEEGTGRAPQDRPHTVALGATAAGLAGPLACGLGRALATRGHAALVVDDSADLHSVSCYTPAEDRGAGIPRPAVAERGASADPQICLVPLPASATARSEAWNRLLLAVDVSREGMRHAYLQIKRLHMHDKDVPIGVTMLGAADEDEARRCFDLLAAAASRFLDLRILSYGWLTAAAAHGIAGGAAPDRNAVHREILGIADLLLDDRGGARGEPSAAPGGDRAGPA